MFVPGQLRLRESFEVVSLGFQAFVLVQPGHQDDVARIVVPQVVPDVIGVEVVAPPKFLEIPVHMGLYPPGFVAEFPAVFLFEAAKILQAAFLDGRQVGHGEFDFPLFPKPEETADLFRVLFVRFLVRVRDRFQACRVDNVGFCPVFGEEPEDFVRVRGRFHHHAEFLALHVIQNRLETFLVRPHVHRTNRFPVGGYRAGGGVVLCTSNPMYLMRNSLLFNTNEEAGSALIQLWVIFNVQSFICTHMFCLKIKSKRINFKILGELLFKAKRGVRAIDKNRIILYSTPDSKRF